MNTDNQTNIVYLDTETSVDCPIGNNKAHWSWPANHIVAAGAYNTGSDNYYSSCEMVKDAGLFTHMEGPEDQCIVGHNVPFDINHYRKAMKKVEDQTKLRKTMTRDTAIAEYLLSAQQNKFPSLDELAVKYGLPLKDDKLKILWNAGVRTEDIDQKILIPYLKQDVMNTKDIFEKQVVELAGRGMLNLYKSQCDAQMAVTEMMYNGMHVDKLSLAGMISKAELEIARLQELFKEGCSKAAGLSYGVDDMDSPKALSLLFFGGEIKGTRREVVGKYKNGKDKYVTKHVATAVKGLEVNPTIVGADLGKNGYYSVDEKVLTTIIKTGKPSSHSSQIADIVLKYRTVKKELSTYLLPIKELTFPDGCIHGNINTTATTTGRYSSSNPNLQNITDFSDVKTMFTSRWGKDGVIMEADFNQLEIVGLAYLSQDRQLIDDINAGVDIHTALYIGAFGTTPSKAQRKAFKRVSFALIYGAGVNTIAEQTNISKASVRAFCDAFSSRYPEVVAWWEVFKTAVLKNRVAGPSVIGEMPYGVSTVQAGTGRLLTFREYASDYAPGTMSFSPSQMKNYPVQSFATGDVVPMVLGRVYKALMNSELLRDSCVLVNTVHDSIVLDCKKEVAHAGVGLLMEVMPKVKEYLAEDFGITDFNVNVGVSIRYGDSWKENKDTDKTFEVVCPAEV